MVKTYNIDNSGIYVLDGLISPAKQLSLYRNLQVAGYTFFAASKESTHEWNETMAELDPKDFKLSHISGALQKGFSFAKLPLRIKKIYKVFINSIRFGDVSFIHSDTKDSKSYSALIYANVKWEPSWGGETLFYDSSFDPVVSISPKPGRIVLFPSNTLHRAGIPSPACQEFRYTVSVRITT